MGAIPNGSIVKYVGHWPHTELVGFGSADQTVADVGTALVSNFQLYIKSSSTSGGLLASVTGSGFDVSLELQVENGLGYGSPDDIISVIRSAVYRVLGDYPASDSIPSVQVPGAAAASTGQPGTQATAQSGCTAGSSSDLQGNFDLTCWFKNLTTTGFASVGVLALLAVLSIGLFIFAGGRVPRAA